MAQVWLYASLRQYTNGKTHLQVPGATVRELVQGLVEQHPPLEEALVYEGDLMPGIAVVVDGVTSNLGMLEPVEENSEVHFLPAIGGGSAF